ncbi:MAG: protein translocase subunit SecD [Candidatus Aminicenantes bacterium]|nr:protein translocase subunit SecD [Candidatus Aminicenantes bacterium]
MRKNLKWKVLVVVLVTALAIFLAYPPQKKINPGLDLKGGMHLVFQVVTDDAVNFETNLAVSRIREELEKKNYKFDAVAKNDVNSFTISNTDPRQEEQIRKELLDKYFRSWEYNMSGRDIILTLDQAEEQYIRRQAVVQARETITNRIDQFGVAEPLIQIQGEDRIIIELPGVEDEERAKGIIKDQAVLEWKLVLAGPAESREALLEQYGGEIPQGAELLEEVEKDKEGNLRTTGFYIVSEVATVTGNDLRDARRSTDDWDRPAVSFSLNPDGAKRFEDITRQHTKELLAIVLDGRIISAPIIDDVIIGGSGIIRGRFTQEEAEDLALKLRAGALPASVQTLEERTIGPSLGADSIRKGLFSIVTALILVVIFMVFYYKLSGINAVIALVLNIIILMGALAYFKATLTLPGIAGIILTVGMSVDANVLVFERIREELSARKPVLSAISSGFGRAFRTILDANITTIIAAIFLFQFGTGPLKGFAITLIIGITASMFTAVFVSRLIFDLTHSRKKKREKLSI